MALPPPSFMPPGMPGDTATEDVLEQRPVPGISFHREGDGILFYYDQPLLYVAWYRDRMVLATLTDEAYEGPPERAKGWKQTLLVEIDPDLLAQVANSELPLRAAYDREGAKAWFVHEDWQYAGEKTWSRQVRVFDDVDIPDSMKPTPGVHLDPGKADAPAAS